MCIYRESVRLWHPPGCGTQETQTRAGHISQNAFVPSALCGITVPYTLKIGAGPKLCLSVPVEPAA